MIPDPHLKSICRIGRGEECCRYLLLDKLGFMCGKFSEFKESLDQRVLTKAMNARGDNCDGLISHLKSVGEK